VRDCGVRQFPDQASLAAPRLAPHQGDPADPIGSDRQQRPQRGQFVRAADERERRAQPEWAGKDLRRLDRHITPLEPG
jgi:hypothetical protein